MPDQLDRAPGPLGDEPGDLAGLGHGHRALPGAQPQCGGCAHPPRSAVQPGRGRPRAHPRGDRVDRGGVQVEQDPERVLVGIAAGRPGQFLDPDRRRVQQLVHHPAHGPFDLIQHAMIGRCAAALPAGPAPHPPRWPPWPAARPRSARPGPRAWRRPGWRTPRATMARTAAMSVSRAARYSAVAQRVQVDDGAPRAARPRPGPRPGAAARSSSTSGRGAASGLAAARRRSALATSSAVITTPVAPVHEMTRSASASRPARLASRRCCRPTAAASRRPGPWCGWPRRCCAAPSRAAVVAASELIEPAPTTSTVRPRQAAPAAGRAAPGRPRGRR